ncbi:SWIM zinc finger family protein [Neobacillus mesonae]|uniref:SWIM zinc finger family protein n=1 Tax=Neobacillus mesonae TaxID=1193713 RepID=UPI00203F4750|nr:SWIM zinc finger family protein [Neobacillus mesonae]MCM3567308.1 SWIM zinc finger family protein [Neobacillus mesonae]
MEFVRELSDEIRDLLSANSPEDARLVQKGLMLYRQGLVTQLQVAETGITAVVEDVTPAKVILDPQFLGLSECSCPLNELCRHQMAVFFAAYAQVGSVSDWVTEWREPVREKKSVVAWGLQKAKDLVKANGLLKPDYERWVSSFEKSFDAIVGAKKHTNPFVVSELFGIYRRRLGASAPVEQEWKLLYELVAEIVSFRKLAVLNEQMGHSAEAVRRSYGYLFEASVDEAEDLVDRIGMQTLPFDFDEFVAKLQDEAFGLLTVVNGLEQHRISLYRLLWSGLFKKTAWREAERERVLQELKHVEDDVNSLPLVVGCAHLSVLLDEDDQALSTVELVNDEVIFPYFINWIEYLSGLKAWKRVGRWIDVTLPKLKGYLDSAEFPGGFHGQTGFVRTVLRAIMPYVSEAHRLDVYERALLSSLPYSYSEYEYMLFERGMYDRWGDLQAYVGMEFQDLPKDRVKVIEKEQPEVLLGMLHQAAQREINQKNRASYRMAVRHLKKLRTLYKKLKRVDDWEYFFEGLLERTKRLRAFHEECERGKLIV